LLPQWTGFVLGEVVLSQSDPTDSALAAIASIFERPAPKTADKQPDADITATPPAEEPVAVEEQPEVAEASEVSDFAPVAEVAEVAEVSVDGYSKSGPGPLEQLRFKWTARRTDDGQYFVDETVGYSSLPISSGPMPKDAVMGFIDEREREARMRFDALRSQIFNPSERGRDEGQG
jgi:hypothetical protein